MFKALHKVSADGYTYERAAIARWFETHSPREVIVIGCSKMSTRFFATKVAEEPCHWPDFATC